MTAISESALKEVLKYADALIPGILSDHDIKQEMFKHGHITIEPYDEKLLRNCSYEIQLDDQVWRMNSGSTYNVDEKELWYGPLLLPSAAKDGYGLTSGQKYLILRPHETVLVSTKETLGSKVHIVGQILPDPSLSSISVSTKIMDIGTVGKCYYTIRNNASCPIIIPAGRTVARLVFYHSTMPDLLPSSTQDEKEEVKEGTADVITIEAVVEKPSTDISLPDNGRLPHARPLPPPPPPQSLVEARKRAFRRETTGQQEQARFGSTTKKT